MASPLQVDVSVFKGNIKVDLDYLFWGGEDFPGKHLLQFVNEAETVARNFESELPKLPFDVGIRSARGGFSTKGGLHYHKTIFVDLSVERGDLMGPEGDRFLREFKKFVQGFGGELTNKGRRVASAARATRLAERWIRREGDGCGPRG
jgi:hypothetical protein